MKYQRLAGFILDLFIWRCHSGHIRYGPGLVLLGGQNLPRSMKGPLLQMVQPILQIIAASKGIPMNEYLMRRDKVVSTCIRIGMVLKRLQ